ncbi:MAG: flagellar FlbD family protein [Bryobacterales bacterium]|nr:flagellar FlbD family protein [Bryobacterales bacterium]
MIQVTRLNQQQLVLNSDLIEHVESTPDTVITLTTGTKFMVRESADEIIRRVAEFRRQSSVEWRNGVVRGGPVFSGGEE